MNHLSSTSLRSHCERLFGCFRCVPDFEHGASASVHILELAPHMSMIQCGNIESIGYVALLESGVRESMRSRDQSD
jgi:hypothetical protein